MPSCYEDKDCYLFKQLLKQCGASRYFRAFANHGVYSVADLVHPRVTKDFLAAVIGIRDPTVRNFILKQTLAFAPAAAPSEPPFESNASKIVFVDDCSGTTSKRTSNRTNSERSSAVNVKILRLDRNEEPDLRGLYPRREDAWRSSTTVRRSRHGSMLPCDVQRNKVDKATRQVRERPACMTCVFSVNHPFSTIISRYPLCSLLCSR